MLESLGKRSVNEMLPDSKIRPAVGKRILRSERMQGASESASMSSEPLRLSEPTKTAEHLPTTVTVEIRWGEGWPASGAALDSQRSR